MLKKALNWLRTQLRRGLGFCDRPLVIYKTDFPDGRLTGRPIQIGAFSLVDYGGGVTFGRNVKVGYGVTILSVSSITGSRDSRLIRQPVSLGDNVEIGSQAVILPGVTIGRNSTIGAGAVVTHDIPENVIAVGQPARPVKHKKPAADNQPDNPY